MISKETQRFIYAGMSWWMRDAAYLSDVGKRTEAEHITEFDQDFVNQSIVYTRQDLVLVVSLLDSLNKQLRWARWTLLGILAALVWIAVLGF